MKVKWKLSFITPTPYKFKLLYLVETESDKFLRVAQLYVANKGCVFQMIGCGDFKQLPPVPKYRYSDPGYHCFESEIFNDVFPHHFELVEVIIFTN